MSSYKKIVEEYTNKFGFDVNQLISMYEEGDSRAEMVKKLDTTQYRVSEVLRLLRLRLTLSDGSLATIQDRKKYTADLNAEEEGCDAYREQIEKQAEELDNLYDELHKKEKSIVRARDTTNMLRKAIREQAREDTVWDTIENKLGDYIQKVDFHVNVPKIDSSIPDEGAAIFYADQHVGVSVSREECGNEYNSEVFKYRLNKVTDDFLSMGALSKNLRLNMIGDSLESLHLLDQLNNAELDIFQQIDLMTIEYLKQIKKILNVYETITAIFNQGNHSRLSKEKLFAKKYLNYETFLYKQMSLVIKVAGLSDRVKVVNHISTHYLDTVNGVKVLTTHGDVFRSVVDSAVMNQVDYCREIFGDEPNVIAVGHFHKFNVADFADKQVLLVRSLKGWDGYYANNLFKINKPGMTWCFYGNGEIQKIGNIKVL